MKISTEELIKENESYFDDDSGSDDENFCRGRLQGRLDVLEDMHEAHHDHYSCICSTSWRCNETEKEKKCSVGLKIMEINDALHAVGETGGKDGN